MEKSNDRKRGRGGGMIEEKLEYKYWKKKKNGVYSQWTVKGFVGFDWDNWEFLQEQILCYCLGYEVI